MSKPLFFKVSLSGLSAQEKKVIKILERVGKEVHKIWNKQVDYKSGETTFYPENTTKEELLEAAKKDSSILSPYTVVKKDPEGKIYALNFSVEYEKEILKICSLLDEAAKVSKDRKFSSYLSTLSRAYRKGDYTAALIAFLTNGTPKIDVLMGPIESYNDELLGVKRSFQFSLRVIRGEESREVDEMVKQMNRLSFLKPMGSVSSLMKPDKISVRVDDVLMFAGRQAGSLPSSTNLPNEPELLKRYGTKIIVYSNSLYKKFDNQLRGYMNSIAYFDTGRTRTAMKEANYRLIVLHEVAEGVVKFKGMSERLGQYHDVIRELNADLFGIMSAKYHVLNGLLTVDQYNELLVATIIFAVNLCNRVAKVPSLHPYAQGHAVMFNYMLRSKALTFSRGKIKFNFDQMSTDIDALSNTVVAIMREGIASDAERLLAVWGDEKVFKKLPKA